MRGARALPHGTGQSVAESRKRARLRHHRLQRRRRSRLLLSAAEHGQRDQVQCLEGLSAHRPTKPERSDEREGRQAPRRRGHAASLRRRVRETQPTKSSVLLQRSDPLGGNYRLGETVDALGDRSRGTSARAGRESDPKLEGRLQHVRAHRFLGPDVRGERDGVVAAEQSDTSQRGSAVSAAKKRHDVDPRRS